MTLRAARDAPVSRERGFCPCCGYRTLAPARPGSYDVCPVCYWLDDLVGFRYPEIESDYNRGRKPARERALASVGFRLRVSLAEARENFREHGAIAPEVVDRTQAPGDRERDPNHPY